MAQFKEAYLLTKDNEGGYAHVTGDKGGETYAGISRVYQPQWIGWKEIDKIKKTRKIRHNEHLPELDDLVYKFYEENFWDKLVKGDQIIDQQIANQIYDWVVTSGRARHEIQKAIGIPTADVDGQFGPQTLRQINIGTPSSIFNMIKTARINYYKKIGVGINAKFLKGWLNRANRFVYKSK